MLFRNDAVTCKLISCHLEASVLARISNRLSCDHSSKQEWKCEKIIIIILVIIFILIVIIMVIIKFIIIFILLVINFILILIITIIIKFVLITSLWFSLSFSSLLFLLTLSLNPLLLLWFLLSFSSYRLITIKLVKLIQQTYFWKINIFESKCIHYIYVMRWEDCFLL